MHHLSEEKKTTMEAEIYEIEHLIFIQNSEGSFFFSFFKLEKRFLNLKKKDNIPFIAI